MAANKARRSACRCQWEQTQRIQQIDTHQRI
jgi:hypothetical protein